MSKNILVSRCPKPHGGVVVISREGSDGEMESSKAWRRYILMSSEYTTMQ